jgi:hypothetical protein
MLGSKDSWVRLKAEKWLSSFISLASWAVAVGTIRCEVLVRGSCNEPIPDFAEHQDSSIQIQTSNEF